MPARRWRSAACVSVATVTSRFTFSNVALVMVLDSASGVARASARSASCRLAAAAAISLVSSALLASSWRRRPSMKARVCSDKVLVHRLQVVAPRGQSHPFALEPVDQAVQIVEASAFGAPVDDLHQPRAGLELHADSGGAQAGADLAFDRRAQRDQPCIDDGLGAGCLQQVRTGSQPTASTSSAPMPTFSSRLRWVAASCARRDRWSRQCFGRPCCCRGAHAFRRLRAASSCAPAMSSRSRPALPLFAFEVGSACGRAVLTVPAAAMV